MRTASIKHELFSGGTLGDAHAWLTNFDIKCNNLQISDYQKLEIVPLFLEGVAKYWFLQNDYHNKSFITFSEDLLKTYGSKNSSLIFIRRHILQNFTQSEQNVEEYANDFMKIASTLELSDKCVMEYFTEGLNAFLKIEVIRAKPTTFIDAYNAAKVGELIHCTLNDYVLDHNKYMYPIKNNDVSKIIEIDVLLKSPQLTSHTEDSPVVNSDIIYNTKPHMDFTEVKTNCLERPVSRPLLADVQMQTETDKDNIGNNNKSVQTTQTPLNDTEEQNQVGAKNEHRFPYEKQSSLNKTFKVIFNRLLSIITFMICFLKIVNKKYIALPFSKFEFDYHLLNENHQQNISNGLCTIAFAQNAFRRFIISRVTTWIKFLLNEIYGLKSVINNILDYTKPPDKQLFSSLISSEC